MTFLKDKDFQGINTARGLRDSEREDMEILDDQHDYEDRCMITAYCNNKARYTCDQFTVHKCKKLMCDEHRAKYFDYGKDK